MSSAPTAALVVIGNEILSGRTQEANLKELATALGSIGIQVKEVRIVSDAEESIITAVNDLRSTYSYVFTSGGIGSTHDDVTGKSIAQAFGVPMVQNPEALTLLEEALGGELSEFLRQQALMPAGASIIENPSTIAPGFQVENVFVLPGVPSIFRAMVYGVKARLKHGPVFLQETVHTSIKEHLIAQDLKKIQAAHKEVEIGSYPYFHPQKTGTVIVIRGTNKTKVKAALLAIKTLLDRPPLISWDLLHSLSASFKDLTLMTSNFQKIFTRRKLPIKTLAIALLVLAILLMGVFFLFSPAEPEPSPLEKTLSIPGT